jgi:hypothetical protein
MIARYVIENQPDSSKSKILYDEDKELSKEIFLE